jgi:3-hydroxybutyryl-CoA dehydrogenase
VAATETYEHPAIAGSGTIACGLAACASVASRVMLLARSDASAWRAEEQAHALCAKVDGADPKRVKVTTAPADLASCDLVVEAVVEDLGAKQELFRTLDKVCRPGAILATTTSSLPVIDLAAVTSRPEDVVGMHFFNPAALMRLVEVVSTVSTAPDVSATVVGLCASLGKHPVSCADRSGFIVNALLFPYLNDAVRMLEAHYATADDIDTAMKTGCGYPMGPFELLDVVGLDVSLAIQRELYLEFRERGYAPAPLLEHLVTAGYLGRKTGRGFRTYP